MISKFFIDRPIFAAVLSILILTLGLVSITQLPIARFPEITPPTVQVTANYPGANAETVAEALAAPIEQELSGAKNLLYFQSFCANNGGLNMVVTFEVGSDLDLAAVEVQNRLKRAEPRLPQETLRQGITITKTSSNLLLVVSLKSTNPEHDGLFLSNYATLNILDTVKRVKGVGDASVFGANDYSMRIWLNPDLVASKGLSMADISAAIREQNGVYAAGRIGAEPSAASVDFTIPVVTRGRLQTVEEFENIILRANPDGSFLYLKDVGRVELSAQSFDLKGRQDGQENALMLVYLKSGANALETNNLLRKTLDDLSKNFPDKVFYETPYDTTPFVQIAIEEVVHTLFEALFLVALVVLLFLGTWRATLIPLLAVPVAIIGTFTGILVLGFSINTLTLFGLVLAIGIVVDDAIIVVENVERIMHDEGLLPREATIKAMNQVTGPIIAIVLVLTSVFLPVAFLGGLTGEIYKQFAITIAISVLISGIVALTLSPALCALLLKRNDKKLLPFRVFDSVFTYFTGHYASAIRLSIRLGFITILLFAGMLYLTYDLYKKVPTGFIPTEDQGYFIVAVILPPGSSLERTKAVMAEVEEFQLAQPEVEHTVSLAGLDFLAGRSSSTSAGVMFVRLKDWDERKKPEEQVDALIGRTFGKFGGLKEGIVVALNPPAVQGLGIRAGFEYQLQDRTGGDIRDLAKIADQLTAEANDKTKHPELDEVRGLFNVNNPQLYIDVDRERAKVLGVSITDLYDTLQVLMGSLYVNDFVKYGRIYRVQMQADAAYRESPESVSRVYVRSKNGDMVPIAGLIDMKFQAGPSVISRFNAVPSVQFTGAPGKGYSTGDTIRVMEEISSKVLPKGYTYEWSGASFQEITAGNQAPYLVLFGLFIVFLVLSAQYEKWSLPFAVLLGIPSGAFGALLAVYIRGLANDIYFQVGLLTLIGLAAKNAILIVEFSSVLRDSGMSILDAAVEAARVRLRPFIMTSLAFILGVTPLVLSTGAGAAGRHSIGTCVMGGMLAATFLDMFFVPLFFVMVQWTSEHLGGSRKRAHHGAPISTSYDHVRTMEIPAAHDHQNNSSSTNNHRSDQSNERLTPQPASEQVGDAEDNEETKPPFTT